MTDAWELPELVRAATELLEAVARNPYLLGSLPEDERVRLLRAVAEVACPDPEERRQQRRARLRRERSSKIQRDEDVLAGTGIRRLRAKPVFTTPNVFAPEGFVQDEADDAELRELREPAALLRLQEEVTAGPPLLRPAVPGLRRLQLRQAHRDGRPLAGGSPSSPAGG